MEGKKLILPLQSVVLAFTVEFYWIERQEKAKEVEVNGIIIPCTA